MSSWFKLYRKLKDSDLWLAEPFTRGQAWVDLLILARFQGGSVRVRGVKVDVKRGQLAWSEVELSKRWQWSRGKVRRFLNEMEMEQQIEQQKTNVTTLITIINFDKYQGGSTADDTASDTASDTANGTADFQNHLESVNNSGPKNGKNDKNEYSLPESVLTFAHNFYEHINKTYPEKRVDLSNGKVKNGAKVVDKLIRLDGYDLDEHIRPALAWGLKDDFWHVQLNSLAELRKKKSGAENHKFDNLYQKYIANKPKQKVVDAVW